MEDKQLADNLHWLAAAYEQRSRDIKISLLKPDEHQEALEAISTVSILLKTAREKIHSIQYHAGEMLRHDVSDVRHRLDNLVSQLHGMSRAITLTPDSSKLNPDDYPIT